jgi:multicomponent Na+:H+ antiporter subunit A
MQAHGHGGHSDDHHETGFWPAMLWVPAALVIAMQYIGGIVPGAWEALFGKIEAGRFYFSHFPMTWDAHLGVPLGMSLAAMAVGLILGFAPVFTRTIRDIHDGIFPAFYAASTQGGGWAFRLVQTGNARTYLGVIFVGMIALIVYALFAGPRAAVAGWHDIIEDDHFRRAAPEYFIGAVVCFAAILMPIVKDRASRILVLGTVGFGVAGLFYLYQAPDLALTQISIEIVSLILFLLVLSMLPKAAVGQAMRFAPRLVISVLAGGLIGWLALTSSSGPRPVMPYFKADTQEPFAHLGEYFLRNSYEGRDGDRGGGGGNVVNVILVDFRGYDTLGEIVVLGLAALGVWTLLRRRTLHKSTRATRVNLDEHHQREHAHRKSAMSLPHEGSAGP